MPWHQALLDNIIVPCDFGLLSMSETSKRTWLGLRSVRNFVERPGLFFSSPHFFCLPQTKARGGWGPRARMLTVAMAPTLPGH